MNIPTKVFRRRGSDSLPLTDASGAGAAALNNGNVLPATGDAEMEQSAGGRQPRSSSSSLFFFGNNHHRHKRTTVDGSAKSIRLQKPLIQVWKEASVATRTSYILLFSFLFMFWFGIRLLRYNNAHIHLTCRAADCTLSIYPRGWSKQYKVEFPRRQLIDIFAVKATLAGKFIERQTNLYESFREPPPQQNHHHKGGGPPRKSSPLYSHYKGPDENGHYTSYALIFRSKRGFESMPEQKPADAAAEGEHKDGNAEGEGGGGEKPASETTERREDETSDAAAAAAAQEASPLELVDFSPHLSEYLEDIGDGQYRLIMRLFQIPQSRRRVSTMIHRVESYIKKRRQSLLVKENAVPSWQGILLLVIGILGFLLTLLLGQFWDEREHPHQRKHRRPREPHRPQDSFKQAMPPQYEVRTAPLRSSRPTRAAAATTTASSTMTSSSAVRRTAPVVKARSAATANAAAGLTKR